MEYQIPHNSNFDVEPSMDSSAVQVFMAGPFPIVHSAHVEEGDVDLDVALLIGGIPTILAATTFPLDDSWKRIDSALASGDARLGVAGVPHEDCDEVARIAAELPMSDSNAPTATAWCSRTSAAPMRIRMPRRTRAKSSARSCRARRRRSSVRLSTNSVFGLRGVFPDFGTEILR